MRRRDFCRIGITGVCGSRLVWSFNATSEFYLKMGDSDTPVFPFRSGANGWWGFIDAAGQILVSPENSRIRARFSDFYGGLAAVRFDDGSAWMIDAKGTKQFAIYPHDDDWNYVLRDGLLPIRNRDSGKWGYADRTGRWAIAPRFEFAFPFSQERAVVQIGNLRGVIRPDGKWIARPSFSWAIAYKDGFLPVERQKRSLYLDRAGRPAFGRDFQQASLFANGLAAVREADKWGVVDRSGKLVVPFQYEAIWPSSDGPMLFQQNGLWGIMNTDGKPVLAPMFHTIEPFSCGCALVQDGPNGPSHFIGTDGAKLFGISYWRAERFVLDRAPVNVEPGNERAWIGRDGKAIFRWKDSSPNGLEEQMGVAPSLSR